MIDASGRTGIIHAGLTLSFLRFAGSMILCFEEILESSSWLVNRLVLKGEKWIFSFWKDLNWICIWFYIFERMKRDYMR